MSVQREQNQFDEQMSMGRSGEQPWSTLAVASRQSEQASIPRSFDQGQGTSTQSHELSGIQGSLSHEFEDRETLRTHSDTTVFVSSVNSNDRNEFYKDVMVKPAGDKKWLGSALLDTGSLPSFVAEAVARRAEEWGLTTIQCGNSMSYEGLVKGHPVELLGKMELKFSINSVSYRHLFLVVKAEERFELLLGAKFIAKARMLKME
jgi:hypothetical protein